MPNCQKITAKPTTQQSDAFIKSQKNSKQRETQSKGLYVSQHGGVYGNAITGLLMAASHQTHDSFFSTEFSHVRIDLKLSCSKWRQIGRAHV